MEYIREKHYSVALLRIKELEKQLEWISVDDRLPEPDVNVLVTDKFAPKGNIVKLATGFIPKANMQVRYYDKEREMWYPGGSSVSWWPHWKPLPEPPKEK